MADGEASVNTDAGIGHVGRIKEFDSTKESIGTYIKRLKLYFGVNNIPETKKASMLLLLVGAKVYETLTNLVMPRTPEELSFREIEAELRRYFEPEQLQIVQRFQFFKRDQHECESIAEYAKELKKMAISCNFGNFLTEALRDKFVSGLKDERIQKQILLKERDFNEALKTAVSLELVDRQAKEMSATTPENNYYMRGNMKTKKKVTEEVTDEDRRRCACCGNRHLGQCKFRKLKCNKCGQKGHLKKMCKASGKRVNLVEKEDCTTSEEDLEEESLYFGEKEQVNSLRGTNNFQIKLLIAGKMYNMDIDTGASVSIISSNEYEQHFSKFKLLDCKTKLCTFAGSELKVKGKINVPVQYKDKKRHYRC